MKTFYIFKINNNINKVIKKKPDNIYSILNTIYGYNKKDILVAFNIFNKICLPINNNFFNAFIYNQLKNDEYYIKFKSTHMYHDYLNGEESKLIVKKSHIKIKSNKNDNIFIYYINNFSNMFICDFNNNYYILSNKSKF